MGELDLPLLIHGEVTDPEIDIFDREKVFLEGVLAPLIERHPTLRFVLEHITTSEAVNFVRSAPARVAATITLHHLLYNRNQLLAGGIRPHFYCLPVLKRESHRQDLLRAAIGDDPRFFFGSDSAPHPLHAKECEQGCAGCYTSHAALELLAELFEELDALDRLEPFVSDRGAAFYGLPPNSGSIELVREPWAVPESYTFGNERLVPLRAGGTVRWRLSHTVAAD
jgi:dihydroorotase